MFSRKKIKEQFKITIPEPCSEDWNKMTVVDRERKHCSLCEKNVVDFTLMSDDEIVFYFQHNKQKTCGRFTQEQLNKPFARLPETTRPSNWWKAAMLLPLSLFAKNSAAQQNDSVARDSLILVNDTIQSPQQVLPDSLIADSDSLQTSIDSTQTDSTKTAESIEPEESVEIVTFSGSVSQVEWGSTVGFCNPEYILTGDVLPEPVPKSIVMGGTGPYKPGPPLLSFLPLWSRYSKDDPNKDDMVMETDTRKVTDPVEPKPDPVPPTIPEPAWYEAILPPSLRPRRNG